MPQDSALFPRNFRKSYPIAAHGEGCWIIDQTGRRYLDATGQAHPEDAHRDRPGIGEGVRGTPGYPRERPGLEAVPLLADLQEQLSRGDVEALVSAVVGVQRRAGGPIRPAPAVISGPCCDLLTAMSRYIVSLEVWLAQRGCGGPRGDRTRRANRRR